MAIKKNIPIYGNGSEWTEQAMRETDKYPPMHWWRDSMCYVVLTALGKHLPWMMPTLSEVEEVRKRVLNYARATILRMTHLSEKQRADLISAYQTGVESLWPRMKEILLGNRGLLDLFLNGGGAESLTFMIFPAELVPRAIALESAWGCNFDNARTYRALERDDISGRYAVMEPIFIELRRRTWYAQQVIRRQLQRYGRYTKSQSHKTISVFSLGAGLLIEFRKYNCFSLEDLQALNIVACDMDKSLETLLDTVFQHDYHVPFSETGIDYRFREIDTVLRDETLHGTADVALMDGVLSYCSKSQKLNYLRGMKQLLKPGGVIVCDLQLMDPSLIRCAVVHEWKSKMKPELFAWLAIFKMKRYCKKVGLDMKASVDPRNPRPLGVIFELSLPKKKST